MPLSPATAMSDTAKDRFSRLLFYVLVSVMGYLAFQVLSPFLAPLAWAAVFAMMFQGVHAELAGADRPESRRARRDADDGRADRGAGRDPRLGARPRGAAGHHLRAAGVALGAGSNRAALAGGARARPDFAARGPDGAPARGRPARPRAPRAGRRRRGRRRAGHARQPVRDAVRACSSCCATAGRSGARSAICCRSRSANASA